VDGDIAPNLLHVHDMFAGFDYTLFDRDLFDELVRAQVPTLPLHQRARAMHRAGRIRAVAVRADLRLGNDWRDEAVRRRRHSIWHRATRKAGLCWHHGE
jgi:hypothetical protein